MHQKQLEQLYLQCQKELYLYLYGLCQNQALAEDLVQETFLKALLSLPDHHPNFRAWLYLVARNLFLDTQRKDSRLEPLDREPPGTEDILWNRLLADEQKSALYEALGTLEPRKREILLLQYFSRLPQKEIAALLHLRPDHVRVLASRGRQELKTRLEELGYDL